MVLPEIEEEMEDEEEGQKLSLTSLLLGIESEIVIYSFRKDFLKDYLFRILQHCGPHRPG